LIVVDCDIFNISAGEINETQVLTTMVDGKVIYQKTEALASK